MNEQIPDFIKNLNKEDASITSSSQKGFVTKDNQQIPDFIAKPINKQSDVELNSVKPDYKDIEVKQELGVDFDNSFSSNQDAVKQYVDNLSNEDYQTWSNLKDEGYSLDARKAMFDNKDSLYDINAKGSEKYWSNNKSSFLENLLGGWQDIVDYQGNVYHPRSESVTEKLGGMQDALLQDKYQYTKDYLSANENTPIVLKPFQNIGATLVANEVRKTEIGASMLLGFAKNLINSVQQVENLTTKGISEAINTGLDWFTNDKAGYERIKDNENAPTKEGSIVRLIEDAFGIGWTLEAPVATYVMTTLLSEDEKLQDLTSKGFTSLKDYVEPAMDILADKGFVFDKLSEEEKDIAISNFIIGLISVFGKGAGYAKGKISNIKAVQEANNAYKFAKEIANMKTAERRSDIISSLRSAMPEGATLTTKGSIDLLKKLMGNNISGFNRFVRALEWTYKNKDRWLVNRNPNMPAGDLPITPGIKIEPESKKIEDNTIKPTEEPKLETTKTEIKAETPKVTPKGKTSTIREFVDSIKEDISNATKKIGSSNEIYEKLKTSPELQMEYTNTIDPYIKENGANNPQGVIEEPLRDLVETIKEQLQFKRNSDRDVRINQMKTKINVPKSESWKYEADQQTYKELENLLSKDIKDPEKFLNYLLKLPEDKVNTLNRLIPDFSKNLGLIKDTLDLTKSITSSDLLGKFMTWHSNLGGRNKLSLRNYLYRKFAEAYKNKSVKTKMAKIEEMLSQMSPEELDRFEKEMQGGDLRKFEESEIDKRNEKGYRLDTFGEKGNWHLQEIMDSKRPGTNKKVREYLEEKGVKMTVANAESQYRQLTHEMPGRESLAAYSENLDRMILKRFDNPYKGFVFHEFGHRLFNQLGTTQMLDMLDYISKRDGISQEAAFERRAEYFRNYMEYNNIDGKRYILKELGEAFDPKLLQVIEKTKNEVFDLFNLNDKDKGISQIMSDVKHDTEAGKEITSRKPQPLLSRRVGDDIDFRTEWLKKNIDENIDSIMLDREIFDSPYNVGEVMIRLKDGNDIPWSKYRERLTEEQLSKIDTYEEDIFDDIINSTFGVDTEEGFVGEGKFDYKTLKNKNDLKDLLKDGYKITKEDLGLDLMETVGLLEKLKQIDPDIVGLEEKNGKLMVKYLIEGYGERRELPDRPGQIEMKSAPAYAYFTEEQIKSFPKDIQEMINRDEGLYQGGDGGLKYSDGKNLKLGKGYYFGSRKQAEEFGPAIIELERNDWKLKEFKDTQEYQVEASKNGGKEKYNQKLKEEGFDGIKAFNKAFKSDEYNFFENPFKKDLVTTKK